MIESKEFEKAILRDQDQFNFECRPGISCYTSCCGDVNIFLTPYDVLRLRKRLNMSSGEFIDQHTILLAGSSPVVPLVVLKMGQDQDKRCPFVTEQGCTVYEDRPWACRMFPLNLEIKGKYSFIAGPQRCQGLGQGPKWEVSRWLESQGVPEYDRMNQMYEEITGDQRMQRLDVTNPQIKNMFFMATYHLDSFRRFVFQSRFLQLFEIDAGRLERVENDDLELLKLGLDWIRFGLFGDKSMKVKEQVMAAKGKEMSRKGKAKEGGQ